MSRSSTMPATPAPCRHRRRWTTAEFDRMLAEGIIREGSPTFLWDGEIIEPMPENPPHANAIDNLRRTLESRLPASDWTLYQGHPLQLADGFLPQPDLLVLRGPRASYRGRRPIPEDVALLVEVADSTYPDDAGEYLRMYASAGIPRYAIVNIRGRSIELHHDPDPSRGLYRVREEFGLDGCRPLILTRDANTSEFEPIAVIDVLRDSLDDPDPPPG